MSTNNKTIYITTPIYYVNDAPHIGHAYTTILADVLTRYYKLSEKSVFFLTGTDEHGLKVQRAAEKNSVSPIEQCNNTVVRFLKLWEKLNIEYDDFIRTTEDRHKKIVSHVLQQLYDKGYIYKSEYTGRYCVPCERFFTLKDLEKNMLCPECGRQTEELSETNYFFKMSIFQDWLIEYIKAHPNFIQPAFRANEILGFLKKPLGDLCISRPKSRLAWGIELPFDKNYVCYVWFDALLNYVSAVGYCSDKEKFSKLWPANFHLIGKDILTTHTVYWPTMLKAMDLPLPETIFAHGWWMADENKMSKSLGNVVNPMDMIDKYGVDAFRYYLMSEMTPGNDASFSEENFILRYNSNLANDLGNLVSRVIKMACKKCGGIIPKKPEVTDKSEFDLRNAVENAVKVVLSITENLKIDFAIESIMNAVRAANRYLEHNAPWKLDPDKDKEKLYSVIYNSAEALRIVSLLLYPVMPCKMKKLREIIGIKENSFSGIKSLEWGIWKADVGIKDIDALFPRIKIEKASDKLQTAKDNKNAKSKNALYKQDSDKKNKNLITIEKFFETELKTAKILKAEKVKNTDKLIKLEVEVGEEKRELVAGIAQFYSCEELIGKNIIIVANLKPAVIRGIKSHGMLLAAKQDGKMRLITVDGDISSGASVG